FLHDLIVAFVWQDVNGCRSTLLPYVNMLKYHDAKFFPAGHFPDPIEALGIPSAKTLELARLKLEFGVRMQRIFYGTLLFVVAHEVGHVVLKHTGASTVDKEMKADDFALDVLVRNQIDPS